ncbi:hypothetical protein MTR67_035764 [Solanum verrucosum]|uniref:Uncharacterized protein n=1 Tax=Solanum verrucosum TaxID=315347 RepID=A0AAF0ZML4_SOLVR|nr:hypothetical protein MTR67_035764 [Solanum verrucosum]
MSKSFNLGGVGNISPRVSEHIKSYSKLLLS